jgi:hypothetical protein
MNSRSRPDHEPQLRGEPGDSAGEEAIQGHSGRDVKQPATMQQKIAAYLHALQQRAAFTQPTDDVALLNAQLGAYTEVSQNSQIMMWAKELMKYMRKVESTMGRDEQGSTWSMWYSRNDTNFKHLGEDGRFFYPGPRDMIAIGDAMALIVSAELHDSGSAQAFNNRPVKHICVVEFRLPTNMDMSPGHETEHCIKLRIPDGLHDIANDREHPANKDPLRHLPDINYQVSGCGNEDLMERLQSGWKREKIEKERNDRNFDNTRGELLILAVRERDSLNGERRREFDCSLQQLREKMGMTGEEFLRIYEDYFRSSDMLIYDAVRHYRKVGFTDANSIDTALKKLRESRTL